MKTKRPCRRRVRKVFQSFSAARCCRERRRFACGAAGSGVVSGALAAPAPGQASPSAAPLIARDGDAVAATRSGRVAGYIRRGIFTFKGIPYADNSAGPNRFMPPVKPKSWEGVRSSRQYGYVAPQGPRAGWANDEEAFMFAWDDGVQSEDCLRVNVWTPGVGDGKKRPVMVWLHGGGYTAGSGQELRSYDGENLARRGDLVVVSLNHRLNVFGYLDLSKFGDQYAASGNVGMLDIVAALEWVRDNIENFGGNPQMVTIFGQSGGGGKVSTLMAMPAAKGLFHRAIVESGSILQGIPQENAQKVADAIVGELGLSRGDDRTNPNAALSADSNGRGQGTARTAPQGCRRHTEFSAYFGAIGIRPGCRWQDSSQPSI